MCPSLVIFPKCAHLPFGEITLTPYHSKSWEETPTLPRRSASPLSELRPSQLQHLAWLQNLWLADRPASLPVQRPTACPCYPVLPKCQACLAQADFHLQLRLADVFSADTQPTAAVISVPSNKEAQIILLNEGT